MQPSSNYLQVDPHQSSDLIDKMPGRALENQTVVKYNFDPSMINLERPHTNLYYIRNQLQNTTIEQQK